MIRRKNKIITICSSASFYADVVRAAADLTKRGFTVKVPSTANRMKRNNDFNVARYKTWFKNARDYKKKTRLMRGHFKKVMESDAILIINHAKHSTRGYIGGNVLMEMALAFHHNKPIYMLNDISEKSPFKEEIRGMWPIFINGDLRKVR